MKLLSIVVICFGVALAQQVSYEEYKVYRVIPKTAHQFGILSLLENDKNIEFWSTLREMNQPVDVMVSPKYQSVLRFILKLGGIDTTVLIENVQETINDERLAQVMAPKPRKGKITFTEYHRYSIIQAYINAIAESYATVGSVESIGKSYNGQDVNVIKLCRDGCGSKPVILIDCGIHAREWIAPAMCLYIIQEIAENGVNAEMLDLTDWYIIPVLNPDGYEYSHTNKRFWRKTRKPNTICDGTDGNRNFDFHWMEIGASPNECDETYGGSASFSESETAGLRDFVMKNLDHIQMYLTIHSYGQYLLYPYGYTSTLPKNVEELDDLAVDVEAAIRAVNGTKYVIGSTGNALYKCSGVSHDWAMGVGINLSYTIELTGGGSGGFDLPPDRIDSVVKETWEGIKVYHAYVAKNRGDSG